MTVEAVDSIRREFLDECLTHRHRERTDHAVAAGGDHEVDTRDEKHRRRDQRQAETVAKAREQIGGWQSVSSQLEQRDHCASVGFNIGTNEVQ